MSFQTVVPFGGVAGWEFLKRTRTRQQSLFNSSAQIQRDTTYFRDRISKVATARELVADRRLLRVALGAFGLDADISSQAFIRKVLEDGTLKNDALANRLADKRYLEFSKAFGFGDYDTPNTRLSDFPASIIKKYQTRQFEVAIGKRSPEMRLALSVPRELEKIANTNTTEAGRWYFVMGTPTLRKVFETALGMPDSLSKLPLDRQLEEFQHKAEQVLGTSRLARMNNKDTVDKIVRLFLIRQQTASGISTDLPRSAAVAILQGAGFSPSLF